MDLIGVQRWRGKRMLREVRALALLLPLRRLAGSIPSFVSIRLLEPLFVPRLESTGEVQTSKFGEKRHHFCGARLRGAEASTPFQWHRCANSRCIDSRQTALLSLLLPRPPWPPKPSSARVRRHRRQAATRDECLPVRVAQLLQWQRSGCTALRRNGRRVCVCLHRTFRGRDEGFEPFFNGFPKLSFCLFSSFLTCDPPKKQTSVS